MHVRGIGVTLDRGNLLGWLSVILVVIVTVLVISPPRP
jgi:hypothetical protein